MSAADPVIFTDVELESYIPPGWTLAEGTPRGWDAATRAFSFSVIDTSDLDWTLEVKGSDVASEGRIPALRNAVDRLFRQRFKSLI